MDIDLNVLSLRELKELNARVTKAINGYEERKKKEALSELEDKARSMGYSLAELLEGQDVKVARKRTPSQPKYANPANPSDTWSGRGRKPTWFIEALAAGGSPEDFAV